MAFVEAHFFNAVLGKQTQLYAILPDQGRGAPRLPLALRLTAS